MSPGGRRVLFFLSGFRVGGAERQTIHLARLLQERGYDCRFLVFHEGAPESVVDAWVVDRTTFVGGETRMLDPRAFARVWRKIVAAEADLVIAVNQTAIVLAASGRLARRYRSAIVGTFHTTVMSSRWANAQLGLMRLVLPGTDGLVFVSERQRDYWRRRGLSARNTEVIHNGIDLDRFSPVPTAAREAARRELGLAADDYVSVLVGAFRPEKNHRQLIDAVGILRARGVPAKALFVGAGATRAEIEAHAARVEMTDHVRFSGEQGDVRPFVAAADVGVLCSVAVETLSLAALEIMAMGLPMAMTDIGGASEIVEDGVNGFLFPPHDTPALVAALAGLAEPGERAVMGHRARATVEARFSDTLMADRYEALASRLIAAQT